jgi:hypothetical protein
VTARDEFISFHDGKRRSIIEFTYEPSGSEHWVWESDTNPDDLRVTEQHIAEEGDITAYFDLRPDTRLEAGLSLCKTVFVCIVLTLGAIFFTKDANELVLIPIERMIDRVKRIARNPLASFQDHEMDIYKLESEADSESARKCKCGKHVKQEYETDALENTIVKIGLLLALGFGEAGSAIIATNMAKEGDVNPMIDGNKIIAIFGFCDIRQFTDTTEVLLEGVMIFVNEIA